MTKRERVIAALRHEESDIIPYNITFTQPMADKMAAHLNDADFQEKLNNHFCNFTLWEFTEVKKNIFRDEAGVLWDKSKDKDIGIASFIKTCTCDSMGASSNGKKRFKQPATSKFCG